MSELFRVLFSRRAVKVHPTFILYLKQFLQIYTGNTSLFCFYNKMFAASMEYSI